MISDRACNALRIACENRGFDMGVYSFSLNLYNQNYENMLQSDSNLSTEDIDDKLLHDIAIEGLFTTAERNFKKTIADKSRWLRLKGSFSRYSEAIFCSVLANFLFVALCLVIYAVAEDQVLSLVSSSGNEEVIKLETDLDAATPKLSAPK